MIQTTEVEIIKRAIGGTLFLNEVGEVPLPIQKTYSFTDTDFSEVFAVLGCSGLMARN
jgi:hypothetical protein